MISVMFRNRDRFGDISRGKIRQCLEYEAGVGGRIAALPPCGRWSSRSQ